MPSARSQLSEQSSVAGHLERLQKAPSLIRKHLHDRAQHGGEIVNAGPTRELFAWDQPTRARLSLFIPQSSASATQLESHSCTVLLVMATLSGSAAVDVVIRERCAIVALPYVVRSIRRFTLAPLLNRLNCAMKSQKSGAELDEIMAQHNDDMRIDALEGQTSQLQPLTWSHTALVERIAQYAAQHCSVGVVEWAFDTSRSIQVQPLVHTAIKYSHLAVVQLLYPRLRAGNAIREHPFLELALFDDAAAHAHEDLVILDWMLANRINKYVMCSQTASNFAARSGHLDVLKWIYAVCGNRLHCYALQQAALHGQQHVMDWIYEECAGESACVAMISIAKKRDFETLRWLHDRFPRSRIILWALKEMVLEGMQLDVVVWLVQHYPDQYSHDGVVMGALCGDLGAAKSLAARRFPTRKEVKSAMVMAAKHGHLPVLQWLSCFFGRCHVPTRTLWRAVCRGHLNVVRWIVEQRPELLTRERLALMYAMSVRQPKKNVDPKGDMVMLTHWIEAQQLKLADSP